MYDAMMTTRPRPSATQQPVQNGRPSQRASRIEQRWIPVTDASGRTRLESHWIDVAALAAPVPAA